MSLTSKINSKTKKDQEFKEMLLAVEPIKEDYYTASGKVPFSGEYKIIAPYMLENQYDASLVGIAFDYLARFRIAQFLGRKDVIQGWAAFTGFKKLNFPENHKNFELFFSWVDQIKTFVKKKSEPIETLLEISVHLAKLEQIMRNGAAFNDINIDYLFSVSAPVDVIEDLKNLMAAFEENFMIPEVINKKSKVIFNPDFGIGSILVGGADADIFIDGTLYDFKTTKNYNLVQKDNLQMIGYFILNELANECAISTGIGTNYDMNIKRIAFYKARFGEIEYYNVGKYLSFLENEKLEQTLKQLAKHFNNNLGNLRKVYLYDYEDLKKHIEDVSNWDMDEIVSRITKVKESKMTKKSYKS
ncbi:hypothetical protein L1279_000002 [Planomicrobium sp. HSC-17F08]|nr:hypothetical protein [Planomicrobium sp. HSC-17F08]